MVFHTECPKFYRRCSTDLLSMKYNECSFFSIFFFFSFSISVCHSLFMSNCSTHSMDSSSLFYFMIHFRLKQSRKHWNRIRIKIYWNKIHCNTFQTWGVISSRIFPSFIELQYTIEKSMHVVKLNVVTYTINRFLTAFLRTK